MPIDKHMHAQAQAAQAYCFSTFVPGPHVGGPEVPILALLAFPHSFFLCDLTQSVVLNITFAPSLQPPSAPDTHLSLLDIFIFQEK